VRRIALNNHQPDEVATADDAITRRGFRCNHKPSSFPGKVFSSSAESALTEQQNAAGSIAFRLLRITAVSVAGSELLCLAAYALLRLPIDLSTSGGWLMVLAPSVTPAIVAPLVSIPTARARNRLVLALAETEQARTALEFEIAERRATQDRLEFHARHDPLTEVLNRRGFFELAAETSGPRGLLVVDVDDFKLVNDRCGHSGGDQLLCTIADELRRAAGARAVVARLGGDEFVALLPDVDERLAEAVRSSLATLSVRTFTGASLVVSASVGFATVRPDESIDDALTRADQSMYVVKRRRYRDSLNRS
jgi:diguanylate cyclase (GGDEF)-like protein